jgi:hypothetical protein
MVASDFAATSGVTAREGRPRQSVLQKSVFGNAVSRSKTGASRPEGIRSDLSTAGPKLAEHNDCERAAKENDTEAHRHLDTGPSGYKDRIVELSNAFNNQTRGDESRPNSTRRFHRSRRN